MRLSRTQFIVLFLATVVTCVVSVGIGIMVLRTLPVSVTPVAQLTWPIEESSGELGPTPTELVPPTRTPTLTPSPFLVATRYDLQVLREPDNAVLRIERGNEYLRLQAYSAALDDFGLAQELSPGIPEPLVGQGRALFYMRRWAEAEMAFQAALSLDRNFAPAHFWLGHIYYYQGFYDRAMQSFDMAAEYASGDYLAEAWLALAALQKGDTQEAQAAVMRATVLQNRDPLVLIARARVSAAAGDFEAAHGTLIYAQDIEPHNFEILHALALFYLEYQPARIFEAEQLVTQALRWAAWDLERAQALHTQSRIYLRQERHEAAVEALTQAAEYARVEGTPALPALWADLERTAP